jgi:hypothetical protein
MSEKLEARIYPTPEQKCDKYTCYSCLYWIDHYWEQGKPSDKSTCHCKGAENRPEQCDFGHNLYFCYTYCPLRYCDACLDCKENSNFVDKEKPAEKKWDFGGARGINLGGD